MRHPSYNTLTAYVARKGIIVPEEKLMRAFGFQIRKAYPGGLFISLTFSIPLRATEKLLIRGGDNLTLKNGNKIVFEGVIDNIIPNQYNQNGIAQIEVTGDWVTKFARRGISKRWVDNRITEHEWAFTTATTGDGDQQCTVDRENRLRFTPKGVAWADADYAALRYTQPYGQTTKRLKYNYDLQEGAQAWEISVWRSTDASSWTKMTSLSGETYATGTTCTIATSGTGSIDVTLATPSRYVELRFYARAAQTPVEDGTYYGEFAAMQVYSETGNINAYEIANDIRAALSLSSDVTWLSSAMTTDLSPSFVTNDYEYYANILQRAANFGDPSGNAIGYGLYPSDVSADGTSALFLESRPNPYTSTTYDYMTTTHIAKIPTLREDYSSIRNWIVVKYTDLKNGAHTLDPDEQSTLTDTTSTADYGTRMLVVDAGNTDAAGALAYGERALAHYKDPIISVNGPIVCLEYVLNQRGIPVPASEVQPGKIINVLDYNGLRGLITETNYNDHDKTVSLTLGSSDDFTSQLAQTKNNAPLPF